MGGLQREIVEVKWAVGGYWLQTADRKIAEFVKLGANPVASRTIENTILSNLNKLETLSNDNHNYVVVSKRIRRLQRAHVVNNLLLLLVIRRRWQQAEVGVL